MRAAAQFALLSFCRAARPVFVDLSAIRQADSGEPLGTPPVTSGSLSPIATATPLRDSPVRYFWQAPAAPKGLPAAFLSLPGTLPRATTVNKVLALSVV